MLISHQKHELQGSDALLNHLKTLEQTALPIEEELLLYQQLQEFELGRFLLEHKGLNGYWTSYVIRRADGKRDLHPLEHWLLYECPGMCATQERFAIFSKCMQSLLRSNMHLASLPCGLMDDLLLLDYSKVSNIALTGIDFDDESLVLAKKRADYYQDLSVDFIKCDAFAMDIHEQYDLLTSNGLNIYEPDEQRLMRFYKNCFNAIKSGGYFLTSFLSMPPGMGVESSWKPMDEQLLLKQVALFRDVMQVVWRSYTEEKTIRQQFSQVGFHVIDVIYDSRGMFPTILAQKP